MSVIKNNKNYGTRVKLEDVPPVLTTLNATANGTYTPTSPVQGYSSVTVNVGNTPVDYFYVEDASGSDNTLSIVKGNEPVEVFYSTDQTNWTSMGTTSSTAITATVPANSKLYLKTVADKWNEFFAIDCSGVFKIGGGIMSLLYGDNFADKIFTNANTYAFARLFGYNSHIIGAEDLVLPSNVIDNCYNLMFYGAENLVTAPVLPATTLAQSCYESMFVYCISMTTAPALPATALAKDCYKDMFSRCLFTTAPALPAPVLVNGCYGGMFKDCTNLTNVTTYANDISASGCLSDWVNNVAATGDFYNLGSATYTSGVDGIPSGWTEHNSL